ncbi:MAG: hypothetical protein ABW321_19205 [Polyangiales bacterium]
MRERAARPPPFGPDKRAFLEDHWHPNAAGNTLLGAEWCTALAPLP